MKNYEKAVKKIEIKLKEISNGSSEKAKEIVEVAKLMIGGYAGIMEKHPDLKDECLEGITEIFDMLGTVCRKKSITKK